MDYDLIVIGAGPGGYACAIKAAQLGLKTAIIEGRDRLGGTCLNVGCIPSKALLHATHMYAEMNKNFASIGIDVRDSAINWPAMQAHKNSVIDQNTKGLEYLFKANGVTWVQGWAEFISPDAIRVSESVYSAKNYVIATGSQPQVLPGVLIDETRIVSSTGALDFDQIPKSLVVIGAGVIGLELGSVYARLGCDVTVFEYADEILPELDQDMRKAYVKLLKKQGLKFILSSAVTHSQVDADRITVTYTDRFQDKISKIHSDKVLVATGRRANTRGLALEKAGISLATSGKIPVDAHCRTAVSHIFAIGDVIAGPMLAHKAEDEAIMVAEQIAGAEPKIINYHSIPSVIYTHPELATVGISETRAKLEGFVTKSGVFPFVANGRAKAAQCSDGFVKIITDNESGRILGAQVLGPSAGDMIHEICLAMELDASASDLASVSHAHPTYSEAIREAAMACQSKAIHFI